MSIEKKLTYLKDTKALIRKKLNRFGINVSSENTFRSYVDFLDEILNRYPKSRGQGTEVTLENTIEAPFIIFDVEGNSEQDGTPSPDNEVPILSSGDNGSINEKIINKNFATNITGNVTRNGLTFKVNDDKSITINGTATSDVYYILRNDLSFKAGETWSLSGCNGGSSTTYGLYCYNIGDLYNGTKTTTLTSDFVNRQLGIIVKNGTTLNNVTFYPQLELNSQATDYVLPQEQDYSIFVQQPMRSIGDVRDKFVKVNGNWFERHYIGRKILNGTENWEIYNTHIYLYDDTFKASVESNDYVPNYKCNYFIPDSLFNANSSPNGKILQNTWGGLAKHKGIAFNSQDTFSDVATLKTWLSTHNVVVHYELAEPLDLPCTQSQIQQLENKPSTYKDFTIIQSQDETPAYLEVAGLKED